MPRWPRRSTCRSRSSCAGPARPSSRAESRIPDPTRSTPPRTCGEHDRDAEDARVDEGLQIDAVRPGGRHRLQAAAEYEQEQERLDQRCDDPQAVRAVADQLAAPDDLDRAELRAQ